MYSLIPRSCLTFWLLQQTWNGLSGVSYVFTLFHFHLWCRSEREVGGMESAHDSFIWSLSWHPLGHILCSGSNDHTRWLSPSQFSLSFSCPLFCNCSVFVSVYICLNVYWVRLCSQTLRPALSLARRAASVRDSLSYPQHLGRLRPLHIIGIETAGAAGAGAPLHLATLYSERLRHCKVRYLESIRMLRARYSIKRIAK